MTQREKIYVWLKIIFSAIVYFLLGCSSFFPGAYILILPLPGLFFAFLLIQTNRHIFVTLRHQALMTFLSCVAWFAALFVTLRLQRHDLEMSESVIPLFIGSLVGSSIVLAAIIIITRFIPLPFILLYSAASILCAIAICIFHNDKSPLLTGGIWQSIMGTAITAWFNLNPPVQKNHTTASEQ